MRFFWMSSFSYCSLGHSKFLWLPEVNVYFWILSMLQSWESMMGQETQLVSLTQPDLCFSSYLSCTYISYSWLLKVCNDLPSLQQIPLTSIPSRFCYEEGCTKEDPLSQENIRKLAEPLPFAKHIHSKLVCYISKELMNEDNPPLVLPNGYVYSTRVRVSFMNMVRIFMDFYQSVCLRGHFERILKLSRILKLLHPRYAGVIRLAFPIGQLIGLVSGLLRINEQTP